MDDSHPLWVFTPSRSNPEDLESILVQRHTILQDAVERVKESALTDHKHHLLFVGPRGCGKTHLTTLIVYRLGQDAEVNEKLRIAWLNEDETCTSVLELLLRIHAALEKRYPSEYQGETIGQVFDMEPADAQAFLQKHLVGSLKDRTLLVVAENLDAIFEGLGDKGQKQLRAFIQENPYLTLVATAQRLVDDLSKRTNPFFGFFQTEHLKPLNVAEATELLQNIARLRENQEVVDFLATSRGRSRVRALHHLSGGNHRIYIVLSQFITRDSIDALVGPFMKMVDELTPYYQERIRWLPIQQRKIVEYLCTCETTVPVKDIAKRLFSTPQTISSQLQSLREKGYVEASQRGRESLYEITEPLMRICVEVKENQTHEPLRLLVNFLRVWYDDSEMNQKLGVLEQGCIARRYLESAINRNNLEGSLRKKIFINELEDSLPENLQEDIKGKIISACKTLPEEFTLVFKSMSEGKKDEVFEYANQIINNSGQSYGRLTAIMMRAGCWSPDKYAEAIDDYTEVINSGWPPHEVITFCLLYRANLYAEYDCHLAIADYTRVIETKNVQKDALTRAFLERGLLNYRLKDYRATIADLSNFISISSNTHDKQNALFIRALAHRLSNNVQDCITDLSRFIESTEHKDFTFIDALFFRSQAYISINSNKAQEDLEEILLLDHVASDIRIDSLLSLASLYYINGRYSDYIELIEKAITIIGDTEAGRSLISPLGLNQVIYVHFTANISAKYEISRLKELINVFQKHKKLDLLGYSLTLHLGSLFQEGEPFPPSAILEAWYQSWQSAAGGEEELALPLRILRIGIDFLKQGGTDDSILLTLTAPEREILKQALGLSNAEE